MVTEYNRNILIKRRQAELEKKATSSAEVQIENEAKTAAESAVAETSENTADVDTTEKPKKTDAEKLSRRKKQG